MPNVKPILYSCDIAADRFDSADLFDLVFLFGSADTYSLTGVVLPAGQEGSRAIDALAVRAGYQDSVPYFAGASGFTAALESAEEPVNVVAVANFASVAETLAAHPALFREKVARLFLVGGHVNDYGIERAKGEILPIDPRLKERNPERFAAEGDLRLQSPEERTAFATLLTSGEGVIFLPRDICLWRYAAPQMLVDGGPACELLLRELFYANLPRFPDRFAAADAPALLSALPALLLAAHPDPTNWLRLFRAVTARVEADPQTGRVTAFDPASDRPNVHAVVGIDGGGLGRMLTAKLRVRPLPA